MNEMATNTDNQLVIFDRPFTPATLFVPGTLDPLIEHIRKEVTAEVTDPTTAEGRKRIISLAMKVTKSKTTIDAARKELVAGEKRRLGAIDAEGKKAWDALEALAKEVRQPVTDFEKREDERIEAHRLAIEAIKALAVFQSLSGVSYDPDIATIEARLAEAETASTDHEEFTGIAVSAKDETVEALTNRLAKTRKAEAEREELDRLRKESAEREQRDREAQAAAKAKEDAERLAAERVAAAEREKADAEAAAEKARQDLAAAEQKAIADQQAAAERAEADRIAAEEESRRREEAAAQRERDNIAAHQAAEAEATRQREADKAHRAKVNKAALVALIQAGLSEDASKMAIVAIAKRQIPNVHIDY